MSITFVGKRLVAAAAALLLFAACGGGDDAESPATGRAAESEPVTLRLGYFPNVTHAPAIVGLEEGMFADALGSNVTLETATFNAGTEAIEALFSGAVDATFIGPNPAINGFAQSDGDALRIVSGTTSGGAALVVTPEITSPDDLAGATLATPSLGNTQDVALRAWLADEGFTTDVTGGGDVSIVPQANADTLTAFQQGNIDGAWVPEPWATRLILEGGGHVLVDEADLWPDGRFVTTHLIVGREFLDEHPGTIRDLLSGLVDSIEFANANPEDAQRITNDGIEAITNSALPAETIQGAWENLTFTWDPVASSLVGSAEDAEAVGLLDPVDLDGIYDLNLLNEVLVEHELEKVESAT
jgi:NitT/TauT family transport system substrate-binding protein